MRALLGASAMLLAMTHAYANQGACRPLKDMVKILKEQYGEEALFLGYSQIPPQSFGVLTISPRGNWTFLIVNGETACIAATGTEARLAKLGNEI